MEVMFWLRAGLLFGLAVAVTGKPPGLSGQGQTERQNENPPISLVIAARASSQKKGSNIWVEASLKNTSDHILWIYKSISEDMDQGGWVYQVDVHEEHGSIPPKTKYALNIGAGGGSGGYVPLRPGETLTQKVNVSKLYDLSQPGRYTIQFRRLDEGTKTYIVSNPITVTITR